MYYSHVLDTYAEKKVLNTDMRAIIAWSKYKQELSKTDRYFMRSLFNEFHVSR